MKVITKKYQITKTWTNDKFQTLKSFNLFAHVSNMGNRERVSLNIVQDKRKKISSKKDRQ